MHPQCRGGGSDEAQRHKWIECWVPRPLEPALWGRGMVCDKDRIDAKGLRSAGSVCQHVAVLGSPDWNGHGSEWPWRLHTVTVAATA